jgi:hypothetical protein
MIALAPAHPADLRAWPWLPELLRLRGIYMGPTGEVLRVCECGRARVVGLQPRPWSVSFYPTRERSR